MNSWTGSGGSGRKKSGKKPPPPIAPPRSQYSLAARHEAILLKSLQSESIRENSLQDLVNGLKEEFPDKNAQLGVCNSIILMLQSPSVLHTRGQKVGAVALLLGLQRKENKLLDYLEDNPFALVLHSLLLGKHEDPSDEFDADQPSPSTHYLALNHIEKVILAHLTLDTENSHQMWTTCFSDVLKGGEQLAKQPMPDLTRLKIIHEKEMKTLCASGSNLDVDATHFLTDVPFRKSGESPDMDNLSSVIDDIEIPETLRNFVPEFITLAPPNHDSLVEMWFMLPTNPIIHQIMMNSDIEPSPEETEGRLLFNQALQEPLSQNQRQTLLCDIRHEPRIIMSLGLTPSNLPSLIEHNPLVAVDVLLWLIRRKDGRTRTYLDVLLNLDISVNSMEVVNRLASVVELPKEFLHLFVANCIQRCEAIQDKFLQNRLARLICVFVEALLRNSLIEVQLLTQDLYFEIMTFSLEFSRIREAAALFRHIKQFVSPEDGGGSYNEAMNRLPSMSITGSDSLSRSSHLPELEQPPSSHYNSLFK